MIWFTSDTHYGHTKLVEGSLGLGLRPKRYASTKEMDEDILEACNSHVKRTDTLYHLGDFAFTTPEKYRMRIKCGDVRLIWGNHDKKGIGKLFKFRWDVHTVHLRKDAPVWLSHYPHFYWPKSHYGALHLYGHMHSQKEEEMDRLLPERRSMDVGVDNIQKLFGKPRPISEEEVLEILMARKGHNPIEFYQRG